MVSTVNPKRMLYAQFAAVARAMAHEHRLELLELVAQGERSVEALAQHTGLLGRQHLTAPTVVAAGWPVTAKRDGKYVLYQLADDLVLDVLSALQRVAKKNVAEVDRIIRTYFHERDNLEPVSQTELMERMKKGLVTVLDVRPEDEFAPRPPARGHQRPTGPAQTAPSQTRSQDGDRRLLQH